MMLVVDVIMRVWKVKILGRTQAEEGKDKKAEGR